MKSLIKAIVFFLIALTVIFYGGAYMLPGAAHVERATVIAAPPGKVFAIAGNLRRVPDWSPWLDTDPATTFSFDGPEQGGVGQVMRWASNNPLVGTGSQTVAGYVPDESLSIAADYGDFGKATTAMRFAPEAAGTRVTWSFDSALPGVIDRWAGLMIDSQLGAEYEKGLARLKALVEGQEAGN